MLDGVVVRCFISNFVSGGLLIRLRFQGNTTCLGTRLAKVELKLVVALFVLGFQHDIVDASGSVVGELALPNWNDILKCRPPKGTSNVRYTRTDLPL